MNRRAPLVAALIAIAVYFPSLSNGFALDDVGDIVENSTVQPYQSAVSVVLSPYRGQVPAARSPYRPLTSLTFWVNNASGGPFPFHLTNVLLHALATGLVTLLLLQFRASAGWSVVGGAVFAVHPVHVEAVANIVGRGDVLMTVFSLLAVLIFLDRSPGVGRRALGVGAAYGMALLSKENGVALPGLLMAVALLIPRERQGQTVEEGLREDGWVIAPTLLVLGGYLALRYHVLGTLIHTDTAPYITTLTGLERTTTAVANLTHIVRLLLVPWDLVVDYGPGVITTVGLASARFAAGGALVGLAAVGAFAALRHESRATLAIVWVALSTLVVSNLVVGIGVWVAERTLYLPSIGVSIGIVAMATFLEGPKLTRLRPALIGLMALGVVAGGWRTVTRIPAWQDSDSVFSTLAEEHPESFRSQWWLGRSLTDAGSPERGLEWFDRAIETNPNDLRLRVDRVRTLLLAGRAAQAQEAAESLPGADPARFVYLAQSHIMLDQLEAARRVVYDGLLAFPRDVRLIRQADELGLAPGARE